MANSSPAHSAIVVDASYLVRLLLPWEQSTSFLDRFTNWRQDSVDICAPDLLVAEVTSVIRQAVYRRWITETEGQVAIEDLFRLDVRIIPSDQGLCSSALAWAGRLGQSKAYDGFYLALAERVAGELWTADERLVNAVTQIGVSWVHWATEQPESK
jgi:predicted nucleic acid-binding protein